MTSVTEFTSAAVSDRGLNESRPQNEDSFIELPQHGLFAVADGVGGAQAGEVASQMAVEILGEAFIHMGDADPEDTMRIALDRANEAIYQMSRDLPQLSSMATTIVAVHVAGDIATIAHVGDSRVYRVDPNGRLFRETDDHSVVEEEVRAGRMTPEQALNHPSRNVISRALGAEDTVEADIKCVLVHPATKFLLCSDGITRHIADSEIEALLNSDFGPEDICARMKDICFSRGAEDNLTAVIVHFPGERPATAAPDEDESEEITLAGIRDVEPLDDDSEDTVEFSTADIASEGAIPDVLDLGSDAIDEPKLAAAAANDDEAYLLEMPVAADRVGIDPAAGQPIVEEPTADPVPVPTSYNYEPETETRSAASGILSTLGLLMAGTLIGAAIIYAIGASYLKSNPPVADVPVIAIQQSDNVPLTAFEKTRRLVDEDPIKYLNARAATPENADEFFWLGRALLLTGKTVEAKRQFEEAKKRLPAFDDLSTARTMSNEIAMAIAIIDDDQAKNDFARQIAAANNANGNANSGSNAAVPLR
ncbi:MAG: hypothetical protein HOP17_04425 [Acidobacteria bacterium]|nr:hypothetical protein [Acidobacteriota bacterium]